MTKPCPICQHEGEAAVWPYLKGGTGANGERIEWLRCGHCHALFSDLTIPGSQPMRPNRGYPHNDYGPS